MVRKLVIVFALTLAHDAPSGWHYPDGCCGGDECHPIPCDSITETKDGYVWKDLHFEESQARPSGDTTCHVCVGKEWINGAETPIEKFPHCIFIQPST
jgi:hypothetical protein